MFNLVSVATGQHTRHGGVVTRAARFANTNVQDVSGSFGNNRRLVNNFNKSKALTKGRMQGNTGQRSHLLNCVFSTHRLPPPSTLRVTYTARYTYHGPRSSSGRAVHRISQGLSCKPYSAGLSGHFIRAFRWSWGDGSSLSGILAHLPVVPQWWRRRAGCHEFYDCFFHFL